jgi:probable F420-dependent oxidoreductase
MEFWQSLAVTEMDQLIALARFAEELGFAGVTVSDHLVKPRRIESLYPYTPDGKPFWNAEDPFPDPWVLIGAMARETTRIRFMPFVYVLPLRDPFNVAKAVSTAALLSKDRVVLGVGVGWMEEEFALTGQAFARRGRRADEMLEVIAKLMTGEGVAHRGECYDFDAVQMAPAPDRRIEIRVGGHGNASFRRAARNDGWLGLRQSPDELEGIVARLREEQKRAGREGRKLDVMISHYPSTPDSGEYERYRDAGATSVNVPPWSYRGVDAPSLDDKRRSLEEFAERYIVPLGS